MAEGGVHYIALVPLAPHVALGPFAWLGLRAHLLERQSSYEAELATLPTDKPRFRVFDWGGFAGINEFVVYDESDEIALPAAQRHQPIPDY
jgi:hypothetical protein